MKSPKKLRQIKSNNYRCETAPSFSHSELNTHSKKEEFLFSHKSSLETLLNVIKTAQISFLSNTSKKTKISSNKLLKKILKELKDSLNSMYKEQKAKTDFFESLSLKQKAQIQSHLYENISKNSNFRNLKTEIEQLKTLNFKVENDIIFIENLISKNYFIEQYLNRNKAKTQEEKEINYLNPKSYSLVSYILHRKDDETKKYFKNLVAIKQRQNDQLNWVTKSIEQLKYLIYNQENGYNNYIYAEDIIPEESKEYTKSITITNINNTINNILNQNKKLIYNKDNDEFRSENSSLTSIENNIDDKNEGNKLNNYINVNMNINFNFNFDKMYNIKEDIKYYSDRDINRNDKKTIKLKNKKGFASTGNLPYLIINSIKEEKKQSGNNNEKEDINKYKNKTVVANAFLPEEFIPTM